MFNVDIYNNIEVNKGETINIILKTNDYIFTNNDKIIFVILDTNNKCLLEKEFNLFEGNKCFIEFSYLETLKFPKGDFRYSIIGYFDNDQVSYLLEDNEIKIKEGVNCQK